MPITAYPLQPQVLRKIHVSDNDFWSLVGNESKSLRLLTNRHFQIGEKVEVYMNPEDRLHTHDLPLIRFVTNITEPVPLFLADDSILIELSVYNSVEL